MFFNAVKIERARRGDLNDDAYFGRIYGELVLSQHDSRDIPPDYPVTFKRFLIDLPSAEHQGRIRRRLRRMARECNPPCRMELGTLRWWDIKGERVLVSAIVCNEQRIPISFFWKRSVQNSGSRQCTTCRQKVQTDLHKIPSSVTCLPHPDSADGYGIRIEAATYQSMKDAFEQWLREPFAPIKH